MKTKDTLIKIVNQAKSLIKSKFIMVISIICIICTALLFFSLGVFEVFVISKLRKIDSQTDSIPKRYWGMIVCMDDIPGENTEMLGCVLMKIYEGCDYSELPVPHKGEEMSGVCYIGEHKVEMTGIVESVCYNTDTDRIIVRCKCTDVIA